MGLGNIERMTVPELNTFLAELASRMDDRRVIPPVPTSGQQLEDAVQTLSNRMDRYFYILYVVLGLFLAAVLALHWLTP